VVTDAQQQVVSGINYKITYDSPLGEYLAIVYEQPWTNTTKVSSWQVLQRKGTSASQPISNITYQKITHYQSDPNFQKIDTFIRNLYSSTLNGATIYDVFKSANSTNYKI
jgi:hypothetical protein